MPRRYEIRKKIKGKGVYDKAINKLVPKYNKVRGKKQDKTDHVLKDGERHVIFKNKDGALVRGQFAGPQTDLVGNLKKLLDEAGGSYDKALSKKNFVSDVDRIALLHDSRYALEGDNPDRVRRADEKMVAKIKDAEKAGESKFNTLPSKLGIQAKIKLSDLGIMKKDAFAQGGSRDEMTDEEIAVVQGAIDWMEQKGYGRIRPLRQRGEGMFDITPLDPEVIAEIERRQKGEGFFDIPRESPLNPGIVDVTKYKLPKNDKLLFQWGGVSKIIEPLKSITGKGLSSNKLKRTKKADLVKMLEQIDVMLD